MSASTTSADTNNGQVVHLPITKAHRCRAPKLQVLMSLLDTAQANGCRDRAEDLIGAIYKCCDALTVSNTLEAGTL